MLRLRRLLLPASRNTSRKTEPIKSQAQEFFFREEKITWITESERERDLEFRDLLDWKCESKVLEKYYFQSNYGMANCLVSYTPAARPALCVAKQRVFWCKSANRMSSYFPN